MLASGPWDVFLLLGFVQSGAQELNQDVGPRFLLGQQQLLRSAPSTGSPWVSLWGHRRWPGQGSTLMNTLYHWFVMCENSCPGLGKANIITNIINITKHTTVSKQQTGAWCSCYTIYTGKKCNPLGRYQKRRASSSQISKTGSWVFFCPKTGGHQLRQRKC